jgi:phage terminase Nu1 subunit (DNA packaging protein)
VAKQKRRRKINGDFARLLKNAHCTQAQFARLLETDQAVISRLVGDGILTRGGDWITWIRELYAYYAANSAGRAGGALNLADERAKLAKMQAAKIGFELSVQREKFVSLDAISFAMIHTSSIIKSKLLSLPHRVGSKHPRLDKKVYISLDEIVRELLTELSETKLPEAVSRRIEEMNNVDFEKATEPIEGSRGIESELGKGMEQATSRGDQNGRRRING